MLTGVLLGCFLLTLLACFTLPCCMRICTNEEAKVGTKDKWFVTSQIF